MQVSVVQFRPWAPPLKNPFDEKHIFGLSWTASSFMTRIPIICAASPSLSAIAHFARKALR